MKKEKKEKKKEKKKKERVKERDDYASGRRGDMEREGDRRKRREKVE